MAAVRHLGFMKFNFFNGRSGKGTHFASAYQILQKSVRPLQRYRDFVIFQDGGRAPSWISWAPIGTTHDDHLMVSIVMQNLVEIDAVVSIT